MTPHHWIAQHLACSGQTALPVSFNSFTSRLDMQPQEVAAKNYMIQRLGSRVVNSELPPPAPSSLPFVRVLTIWLQFWVQKTGQNPDQVFFWHRWGLQMQFGHLLSAESCFGILKACPGFFFRSAKRQKCTKASSSSDEKKSSHFSPDSLMVQLDQNLSRKSDPRAIATGASFPLRGVTYWKM